MNRMEAKNKFKDKTDFAAEIAVPQSLNPSIAKSLNFSGIFMNSAYSVVKRDFWPDFFDLRVPPEGIVEDRYAYKNLPMGNYFVIAAEHFACTESE
jgi:hypothetical protein